jgi:Methylamine utilisation protein MauE
LNDASVALAARVVLAAALTVSALAKVRARAAVKQQVALLVSDALAPVVAPALPATELAVAVALVVRWSPVPGVVALVLLAAFTVVLVRAQARRVPCLCFGAARVETPVGAAAIVRNGVLGALAVLAIGSPAGARPAATIGLCVVLGAVTALAIRIAH